GLINFATVNGLSAADVTVQAHVANLTNGQWAGLTARYSGPADQNMYFGAVIGTSTGYMATIWRNVNGAWTLLASQNYVGSSGAGTLQFQVIGSSLRLLLNGTLQVSVIDG